MKSYIIFIFLTWVAASVSLNFASAIDNDALTLINSKEVFHVQAIVQPSWAGNDDKTHIFWNIPFDGGRIQLLKHETYNNIILEVIPANGAWYGIGRKVGFWKPNEIHKIDVVCVKNGLGKGCFILGIDGKFIAKKPLLLPTGLARNLIIPVDAKSEIIKVKVDDVIPEYMKISGIFKGQYDIKVPSTYKISSLYPRPKKMIYGKTIVSYKDGIVICCKRELAKLGNFLASVIRKRYGVSVKVTEQNIAHSQDNSVVIELKLDLKFADITHKEAYSLTAEAEKVHIAAMRHEGIFRGIQTLRKIMADGDEIGLTFKSVEIDDYPDLPVRGHYVEAMWSGLDIESFKKIIDAVSLAGMNLIFIDHGSTFHYNSVSDLKCNIKGLSQNNAAEIKDLVEYATLRGVTLAPAIRCFSHAEWFTRSFPELAEPGPRKVSGLQNYCPSRPETYDLIFKIINDLLSAYNFPGMMHIGEDEHIHANIGVCDLCKSKSIGELIGTDISKIASYLKSKSTRPYIFNDMITPPLLWNPDEMDTEEDGHNKATRLAKEAQKAISILPKNIGITYWYYADGDLGFEGAEYLSKQGFDVFPMPWKSIKNIQTAARTAAKIGGHGLIGSSWEMDWKKLPDSVTWGALLYASCDAWNVPYAGQNTKTDYSAAELGSRFMKLSDPVNKISFDRIITTNLPCTSANASLTGWLDVKADIDPSLVMPRGKIVKFRQIPFWLPKDNSRVVLLRGPDSKNTVANLPEKTLISMAKKARYLFFLQGGGLIFEPNPTGKILFRYKINYTDGKSFEIPQRIGYEVDTCFCTSMLPNAKVAFRKQVKENIPLQMYIFTWSNHRPNIPIESIEVTSEKQLTMPILLGLSFIPVE